MGNFQITPPVAIVSNVLTKVNNVTANHNAGIFVCKAGSTIAFVRNVLLSSTAAGAKNTSGITAPTFFVRTKNRSRTGQFYPSL